MPLRLRRWAVRLGLSMGVAAGAAGCAISHEVRPLGRGQAAVGASLGGPIFENLGTAIPMPLASVYGRYGVHERGDVDFAVHLPVTQIVGVEGGYAQLLWRQRGRLPAAMAGGRLLMFGHGLALTGRVEPGSRRRYALQPRLFEQLYFNLSWRLTPQTLLYSGIDLFVQAEQRRVRPTLCLGAQWRPYERLGLSTQGSWVAFGQSNRDLAVKYRGLAGQGAWGLHVGAAYYFSVAPTPPPALPPTETK